MVIWDTWAKRILPIAFHIKNMLEPFQKKWFLIIFAMFEIALTPIICAQSLMHKTC